MAKPNFIYGFDKLEYQKFVELCGLLLGSRYNGFLLGGVGPDGGIDGEWRSESRSGLLNEVVEPGELVVFQFKHIVTIRAGQAPARQQLLKHYECPAEGSKSKKKCELHSDLVQKRNPARYVLVTNVEINSQFRNTFIEQCKSHNPTIKHYQIIGLDDLESWITMEPELGSMYFPEIFGRPKYSLGVEPSIIFEYPDYNLLRIDLDNGNIEYQIPPIYKLAIKVMNKGEAKSYVGEIAVRVIKDNQYYLIKNIEGHGIEEYFSDSDRAIEPGRNHVYKFELESVRKEIRKLGTGGLPVEIIITDELNNKYNAVIPEELLEKLIG